MIDLKTLPIIMALVENMDEGLMIFDCQDQLVYENGAAKDSLSRDYDQLETKWAMGDGATYTARVLVWK